MKELSCERRSGNDNPRARRNRVLSALPVLLMVGLAISGCRTPNVNPPSPRADTGYVDFYTDTDLELCWEVKRADEHTGEMRTVFSKFDPVQGNILRLATPAGIHRFQVWFMNRATEGPEAVEVLVEDARVTPAHVTLSSAGTTSVERKVVGFRPSAKGYGRGMKIVSDLNQVLRISVVAGAPQAYQPKERMAYFSIGTN
jgi:hypothetical protein